MSKKVPTKLSIFLSDLLSTGCLKGFQHFELYVRGKEELICNINNHKFNSLKTFSTKSQSNLVNGYTLVPASPCESEIEEIKKKEYSSFLIAGYARYNHPFVWCRNGNQLEEVLPEDPIRLESIKRWNSCESINIWEILVEILNNAVEPPKNPLSITFEYFNLLSPQQALISSGAMLNFLIGVFRNKPYFHLELLKDIEKLLEIHYSLLMESIQLEKITAS